MEYARSRHRFDPLSEKEFRLSRSKLDLYLNCPRCFYLDRRLGIAQPPGYPFNLNNAVDTLLKKEFDSYRERGMPHPLMKKFGIEAVPFRHEKLNEWRDALRGGIAYLHPETRFNVTGGVDDIWVNAREELIIVDYKATSKNGAVTIDADWQIGYKRQMEVYAWLFRRNNFQVADTGYFVYCNGRTTAAGFNERLEFDVVCLPYKINDSWVEDALHRAKHCLMNDEPPPFTTDCDYCGYQQAVLGIGNQMSLF